MRRVLLGLLGVWLSVGVVLGQGRVQSTSIDLTETSTTATFYFSGSATWPTPYPGGVGGWGVWLKGKSGASATLTKLEVTEMDIDGDVSDSSGDWTTLTAFSSLSIDSSTVRHAAVGDLDYCVGVQVKLTVASGGTGSAMLYLYYDRLDGR